LKVYKIIYEHHHDHDVIGMSSLWSYS